jgi:hypothetical protein
MAVVKYICFTDTNPRLAELWILNNGYFRNRKKIINDMICYRQPVPNGCKHKEVRYITPKISLIRVW